MRFTDGGNRASISAMARIPVAGRRRSEQSTADHPRCGLCGKQGKLTETGCCGQTICDDYEKYVPFSYARNSCSRNHDRFTLCGQHHNGSHPGKWQECDECRTGRDTEMYVWYGTNEYNFVKLANPPSFDPTLCAECGTRIDLGNDAYSLYRGAYYCENCPP